MTDNRTIFVTGGTGFLGRHLVPALVCAGYDVRVLTRQPEQHGWLQQYPTVQLVAGDLAQPGTYQHALDGCRYIIHAGAMFRMWGDEQAFMDANVRGTDALLQLARQHPVGRFIHVSTVAVLGQPDAQHVVDETYPPAPMDAYQRSKLEAETLALAAYRDADLPVIVLRPGAYYGPLGHYGFNRLFFRDVLRGLIMQVDGGRYIIFPVYISDVVQGIMKSLDKGRAGEIYNISGDWISHKEAFDIICEEANIRWPRVPMPGWLDIPLARLLEGVSAILGAEPFWPLNMLRSYVHNNWRVSSEKAQRELGFVPTDFREGARQTIAWYQAGTPENWPGLECDD